MHLLMNKPLIAVFGDTQWHFDKDRAPSSVVLSGCKFGSNLTESRAAVVSKNNAKAHVRSFADIFFKQHVSVLPSSIDAEKVLDEKTFEVVLWNTGMLDTQLQSVSVVGFDGVSMSLQLPETLRRLQMQTYEISVFADGPATIAAKATFHFDNASDSSLSVKGQRLSLWDYRPDWSNGMSHEYAYLTDVMIAHDGTEDRVSLRGDPRQSLTYNYSFHADELREAMQKMRRYQSEEWSLPQWSKEKLEEFAQGAASFEINKSERFTNIGDYLYFSNSGSYQVVQVDDIVDDTIILSKVLSEDFYSVVPLIYVCMPSQATNGWRSGSYSSLSLSFAVDPAKALAIHSEPVTDTYKDLNVWLKRPNWISEPSHNFEMNLAEIDYEIGRKYQLKKNSGETTQFMFSMFSEDEIQEVIDFMESAEGRLSSFYMPTFRDDLRLVEDLADGYRTLHVKACGYTTSTFPTSPDLYILRSNGVVELVEVERAEQVGDVEQLTLVDQIGSLSVAEVDQICILMKGRFESDAFTFNYTTPTIADLTKTFRHTHI